MSGLFFFLLVFDDPSTTLLRSNLSVPPMQSSISVSFTSKAPTHYFVLVTSRLRCLLALRKGQGGFL